MHKILLLDADISLSTVLCDYMTSRGMDVEVLSRGEEALERIMSGQIDMLITELSGVGISGMELLQSLRKAGHNLPVIILTSRSEREDMLRAFEAGCDDYVLKPFSIDILILRVQAVLRRCYPELQCTDEVFRLGDCVFDSIHHTFDGQHMSARESELLLLLCRNMGQVVDRQKILQQLWRQSDYFSSQSLSVYGNRLRKFLAPTGYQLQGIHGKGYRLVAP